MNETELTVNNLIEKSKKFRLNLLDYLKGAFIATVTTIIALIITVIQSKGNIDIKFILESGILTGVSYLIKNFFEGEGGSFIENVLIKLNITINKEGISKTILNFLTKKIKSINK